MAKFQGVLLETPKTDKNHELAFQLAQLLSIDPSFFVTVESRDYGYGPYLTIDEDRLRVLILEKLREFDATTGGREST